MTRRQLEPLALFAFGTIATLSILGLVWVAFTAGAEWGFWTGAIIAAVGISAITTCCILTIETAEKYFNT